MLISAHHSGSVSWELISVVVVNMELLNMLVTRTAPLCLCPESTWRCVGPWGPAGHPAGLEVVLQTNAVLPEGQDPL